RALAQLLRADGLPRSGAGDDADASARPPRAAPRRQRLPARAPLLVQPEVLPRVASPLHLRRAFHGSARRRTCLPPCRVAARPTRPVDAEAREPTTTSRSPRRVAFLPMSTTRSISRLSEIAQVM